MAYSVDFRRKAVEYKQKGHTFSVTHGYGALIPLGLGDEIWFLALRLQAGSGNICRLKHNKYTFLATTGI